MFTDRRRTALFAVLFAGEIALAIVTGPADLESLFDAGSGAHAAMGGATLVGMAIVAAVTVGLDRSLRRKGDLAERHRQAMVVDGRLLSDWLWEVDARQRLTYCSDSVTALLGYEPAEVIGAPLTALLVEQDALRADEMTRTAISAGTGWSCVELTWRHQDGTPIALQGGAAAIRDARGRVVGLRASYRPGTDRVTDHRIAAAARSRIDDLLRTGDLRVALQPIVSLSTGRMSGAEALARFADGRGPDDWFADARLCDRELDLEQLAFRAGLAVAQQLPRDCYLSLNAGPALLNDPSLLGDLEASGIALDQLVIEITEHARVVSYDQLTEAIAKLRDRGVRIAVDDTGAGYASMHHVLRLRPDVIKIDRSLIVGVTSDPARRSLITAFVLLALDLGASVAAEGIETPSELVTLAALGVDCGQGYLLGRPDDDAERWQEWFGRNWLQPADATTPRVRGPVRSLTPADRLVEK